MPAISVILPTYNRATVLRRSVDSVLAQDFADFDVIVVDDGSEDDTPTLMQSYCDPRIIYVRQPVNRGGNACRNHGIMRAQSEIICFLDSDDAYLPHKLGFVAAYFAHHPNIDVLVDSFELVYPIEQGARRKPRVNPVLDHSAVVEEAVYSRRLYKATPAISARRRALLAVGLFDETLKRLQDLDLMLRLARSHRCATTDQILWTKYRTAGAISTEQRTFIAAIIEICRRHPDYLRRPDYRVGLAGHLGRHCLRRMGRCEWSLLVSDLRRFGAYCGWPATTVLALRGLLQSRRRRIAAR
jgi:glycosyltransferase involved in cell wall biosynthesis